MSSTSTLPSTTSVKTASTITTKLNLKDVKWVGPLNTDVATQRVAFGTEDPNAEFNTDGSKRSNWREVIIYPPGSDPNEVFPEQDSNGNPCRILTRDPGSGNQTGSVYAVYNLVVYPDGHQQILPKQAEYDRHINAKMCHFALAALAAWSEGEARNMPRSWQAYRSGGGINAAVMVTPTMWSRASIQGYLQPSDTSAFSSDAQRTRTAKPVSVNLKRSRKLKSSAWPFSEKEHWFRIMSGALQITHNNMVQVLDNRANSRGMSSQESSTIKKSFPVFGSNAEFKRSRKFFEQISEKKNTGAIRTDRGTLKGMQWDPLKNATYSMSGSRYNSMQSAEALFSTPYALVKTSMMLSCVPHVEQTGQIIDFKEITPEYVNELREIEPLNKSTIGSWRGTYSYSNSYSNSSSQVIYSKEVLDSINIDNLTHMYMILLNEAHLLSNEDLLRWCDYQGLDLHNQNFDLNFIPSHMFDVFGYKLTDTLNYTCLIWHQSHVVKDDGDK